MIASPTVNTGISCGVQSLLTLNCVDFYSQLEKAQTQPTLIHIDYAADEPYGCWVHIRYDLSGNIPRVPSPLDWDCVPQCLPDPTAPNLCLTSLVDVSCLAPEVFEFTCPELESFPF